jgi:transitional endoplasmic reticulum ATPase
VIAATNEPQKIDAAVRRTGRLDKLIYVGPPDEEARREMLALHMRGRPVSDDLLLDQLAKSLEGYSASDLRFLVDRAALNPLYTIDIIDFQTWLPTDYGSPDACYLGINTQ